MPCPTPAMSLSVQQILSDAKKLVGRLRERDITADNVISRAQSLKKKVHAMKQYEDDVIELNEVARQRPRSALVLGIQQENRHIRDLQQENKELKALLEEHQSTLELIMSKYREHMIQLIMSDDNKCKHDCSKPEWDQQLATQTDKIYEMASVMLQAINIDNEAVAREQETMTRLVTENRGLRELLEISIRSGSQTPSGHLSATSLVDTAAQTD